MIKIGAVIDDRYEILKEIGRGGMSVVYLAMDNRLNKSLVVKDIRKRDASNNELLINSLIVEANMLKKLDHGSLPKIYDIIDAKGDIYVVMDYIEGESLKEKLKRETTIPTFEVIDWAKQLAEVLEYLHTRKPHPIIYRDMKPDNIMLTPEGKIKLIDFGIAREFKAESTTDTINLGTKSYAAPEQLSGKQTDARTDIYSLGVTLYHLVTGKSINEPPFELKPIRHWDAALPEGLEHIINKCTQSEPANRYESCSELLYDLNNINKLTEGYKKKLRKKLSLFLIPVVLFLIFTTTAVAGINGIKNTRFQDYMKLVNAAGVSHMNHDDQNALKLLEKAIAVNKKRPEAYISLLDLFISRDQTDDGLGKIETYIDDEYGNIQKNSALRFQMGMTYFDLKHDYPKALKHFNHVDPEAIPDVQYYETIATQASSMNINYKSFAANLNKFEKFNDGLVNDRKKVDNYKSLAGIYISYKGQMANANTKTIEIIKKAYKVLDLIDDEKLRLNYKEDFESKLGQAYYSRGVRSLAKADLEQAIEHYQTLLDLDIPNKPEVQTKIGVIFQNMGEPARAVQQLQKTIKSYPKYSDAYFKLTNLLLDNHSFKQAKQIYDQVGKIPGAKGDADYKKLTGRFKTLGIR
ncbi:serine/threonine protein kinase [Bacillus sp. MUM 116]|uniref:serine/threonine-protein kinase n=1 Tax=Bacillus sp. MUM 116 TaxID=1678002 RepID=UPI0008F5CA2D|nr:serine/threonine-protein kinase [Bacillus sp. MUM 116]OIK10638.1 serine/threonine protein kinase [Bacillus sp. MUM 116]